MLSDSLSMTEEMKKTLDTFLAKKIIADVDRTKYLTLELRDPRYKINTCLVFCCNSHNYEEPIAIECKYTGVVLHLPAFWVEVPKELAFTYICSLINSIYEDAYTIWYNSGLIGGIGNGSTNIPPITTPGCGCNNGTSTWKPVKDL